MNPVVDKVSTVPSNKGYSKLVRDTYFQLERGIWIRLRHDSNAGVQLSFEIAGAGDDLENG